MYIYYEKIKKCVSIKFLSSIIRSKTRSFSNYKDKLLPFFAELSLFAAATIKASRNKVDAFSVLFDGDFPHLSPYTKFPMSKNKHRNVVYILI